MSIDNPTTHQPGSYTVDEQITLAEAPGLRIRRLTLGPGQFVPWHYHSEISDTFFCMKGPMRIRTRDPDSSTILEPGQTLEVPAGRAHRVSGMNEGPCQFIVVQGVGRYDYCPIEIPPARDGDRTTS